jgi:hypothetical protein
MRATTEPGTDPSHAIPEDSGPPPFIPEIRSAGEQIRVRARRYKLDQTSIKLRGEFVFKPIAIYPAPS